MQIAELVIFFLVPEERFQPGHLEAYLYTSLQPFNQIGKIDFSGISGLQGCAHGSKEMGIFRVNGGLIVQLQGADKGCFQFSQEMQRATQKGNTAPDGFAAGQTGNGLIHHRLKNGGRQIGAGGAFVDERLNVRLGKHAAAGGNGVQFLVICRRVV